MEEAYRENVQKEYQEYKEYMLTLSPEQIFDKCGQVHFYNCMYDYFMYNERISQIVVAKMKVNKTLIAECWEVYLKQEGLSFSSWSEIDELVKVYLWHNVIPSNVLCNTKKHKSDIYFNRR